MDIKLLASVAVGTVVSLGGAWAMTGWAPILSVGSQEPYVDNIENDGDTPASRYTAISSMRGVPGEAAYFEVSDLRECFEMAQIVAENWAFRAHDGFCSDENNRVVAVFNKEKSWAPTYRMR